jgi:hypothetical protein
MTTSEDGMVAIARDLVRRGWSVRGACRAVAERHGVADVETQAAVLGIWLAWEGYTGPGVRLDTSNVVRE